MLRIITITVSCLLLFIPICHTAAQDDVENIASPWAVTADEKDDLLERTENMLLWYRGMNRESRLGTPPVRFRTQMAPLEIMQAAAILKETGQADMSRMVREMLPFYNLTSAECFEIEERLGDATLESFLEDKEILGAEGVDSTTRIREGAAKFLSTSLTPVEKMALIDEPKTAFELMKAIDLLSIAGRPVLIRFYLNRFLALEAEPEEYAEIAEKIGSKRLMQLAVNPSFAPQGAEAVATIFSEAKKHWLDNGVVSQALEEWEGFDEKGKLKPESVESLQALWRGGRISVSQILDRLGKVEDEKEADELLAVLASFTPDVREALAESLRDDNRTLATHAARGLAASIRPQDVFLLYPLLFAENVDDTLKDRVAGILKHRDIKIPDVERAAATLYARGRDYFEKNRPLQTGPDGFVRFWNWSDTEKKAKYVRMSVPAAYRLYAWRYARQAWSIRPGDADVKRLYLTTLFERAAYLHGLDEPLDLEENGLADAVEGMEPAQLERILVDALAGEHYGAARAAATLLPRLGDTENLLMSETGRARPLVQATMARDRRVRFAAVEAVMSLKPEKPYPGSSLVSETLTWFSRADGRRTLVSAHPKQPDAAKTAGHFIPLGYNGEIATSSREAMLLAADSPDVELVLIDLICRNPPVPAFVQEMRQDARTADIPIAVLTENPKALDPAVSDKSLPSMEKADRFGPDDPFAVSLSKVYPRVIGEEPARWLHDDLMEKTGAEPVPPAARLEQARKALTWIREIIERTQTGSKIHHFENLEDTASRALHSDVRVRQGLELAAVLKSGAMQAAIYEVAASNVYPMELRENAVEAFQRSIESYGVLLRGKQVQRLYDRYNQSETEEKDVQELLSRLIDIVEDKTLKD